MVRFEGRIFSKVKRFDCHVLDFETDCGGGFFTVLPIFPLSYRKRNGSLCHVAVSSGPKWTRFDITDDYGRVHRVELSSTLKEEIDVAIKSASEQGLLS